MAASPGGPGAGSRCGGDSLWEKELILGGKRLSELSGARSHPRALGAQAERWVVMWFRGREWVGALRTEPVKAGPQGLNPAQSLGTC